MKNLVKKWTESSLILKIVTGLALGTVLGLVFPKASFIGIPGTVFIGALKAIAPVLVALLVCSAIAGSGSGIGERFKTVIVLYLLSTLIAALVATASSSIFRIELTLPAAAAAEAPGGLKEIFESLFTRIVQNPVSSIAEGNYLGILFWAVVIGLALKLVASESTLKTLSDLSDAVSRVVTWIIQFAPIGILGIMYTNIAGNGLDIFATYGQLILLLVGTMLVVAVIINPFLVFLAIRRNPYPLVLRALKESGIPAFFTRSSAANIPVNMDFCERLGLDKDFYSVSVPLGATVNMNGAAVTITVMSLTAAHTIGVDIPLVIEATLSIVAAIAACGASGVAGGSLLLIPMACSMMGISNDVAMEVVAVGFIIGVIQDSVETAVNSSGDVIFTATSEYYSRKKAGKPMNYVTDHEKRQIY